jgi:hypothetical protein
VRAKIEQAALLLDTIAVWGLYLVFYLVIFGALTIVSYATARRIILGD